MAEQRVGLLHQAGRRDVEHHNAHGIFQTFLRIGHGPLIALKLRTDEGYDGLVRDNAVLRFKTGQYAAQQAVQLRFGDDVVSAVIHAAVDVPQQRRNAFELHGRPQQVDQQDARHMQLAAC